MDLQKLREELKELKIQKGINFAFFAKQIGINKQSFYNFTCGTKGLSPEKQNLLEKLIWRFK